MSENQNHWLDALQERLQAASISIDSQTQIQWPHWHIGSKNWQDFARIACMQQLRWVAGWAEQRQEQLWIHACFASKQQGYLWLTTNVPVKHPELPSQAVIYPAASRSERHSQDMFGIHFSEHPDPRPWLRQQAWGRHQYPLRKDFPVQGHPPSITPGDLDYAFVKARGSGVYEIPVGPVHAGIIEPGHFRFQAVGETILNLEERLGYVHKGIEKIAEGRTPEQLLKLAGRISGDSTVAHSWAACRAMEQAAAINIPQRAAFIRAILCERERIANHLGDIGAICNDVGFAFAQMQFTRLREQWLRSQGTVFGHRLLMDCLLPGGVKTDLDARQIKRLLRDTEELRTELNEIIPALDLNSSLEDRLYTTGFLSEQTAAALGAVGYVGRASGQNFDVRRNAPYTPYDQLKFKVVWETQGDVASRFWVRVKEIFASIKLLSQMLQQLPGGDISTTWKTPAENSTGLAMIEGWRGEIITYVRFGSEQKISRFYARDPSSVNWPTLEKIVLENIVPDFPVCNKSVNGSYSGHDL